MNATPGSESLLLKWGTVKGWGSLSPSSVLILQSYADLGMSMSAAAQHDTSEQKNILCQLIDQLDGEIQNDWTGEKLTKDAAKAYVREYGK